MQGLVSFHPVDPVFFERTIEPLVAGEKINPEDFLEAAMNMLVSAWEAERYKRTLELLAEQIAPPPLPQEGTLWGRTKAWLERFDYKPDPISRLICQKVDFDLHLQGRPFLITEGSADSVSALADEFMGINAEGAAQSLVVEQLLRLDPDLAREIEPDDSVGMPSPGGYRAGILNDLKELFDLAEAARGGGKWGPLGGRQEPAEEALARELPWRALHLHSRAVPFWVGHDVDGLETLCKAAGIEAPDFVVPPYRLFSRSCEQFPAVREHLGLELESERSIGAYVAPADISELNVFLTENGSRIIRAATRHGVGTTCTTLLRKIRECANFAERHEAGYLEAAGIHPVGTVGWGQDTN